MTTGGDDDELLSPQDDCGVIIDNQTPYLIHLVSLRAFARSRGPWCAQHSHLYPLATAAYLAACRANVEALLSEQRRYGRRETATTEAACCRRWAALALPPGLDLRVIDL